MVILKFIKLSIASMGLHDTYYMDMIREKMERSLKCDVEKFVAD